MAKRKKKDSCLISTVKICFYVVLLSFLISIGGVLIGAILLIGAIFLVFLVVRWAIGLKSDLRDIDFDSMNGQEFEDFCVKVLRRNGFINVKVTQGSGDHGIDVLANKNGKRYAIQCKCYSQNVGNKAVQEAYSGKDIYSADIAAVMTNRFFTRQAQMDARKLGVQLWDRNKLNNLICFGRKKEGFSECGSEENNFTKGEMQIENKPKTIKENTYQVKSTTIQITLLENNEVSILIIEKEDLLLFSCIFFFLYIELRDKYKTYSYSIASSYKGRIVNCENEYVYGNNLDGTISRATPDWLEKAREDLTNIDLDNYSDIIAEIENILNDFLEKDFSAKNAKDKRVTDIEKGTVSEKPCEHDCKEDNTVKEDNEKVNDNDIRNTCMIMNAIILETYRSFGVEVIFHSFKFEDGNAVFGVVPAVGVRVKTVMGYEKDLSLKLGLDVKIKLLTGYIGIFAPIIQFKNRMNAMLKDDRFVAYYKMCGTETKEKIEKDVLDEK